jgi:hypothetical protein
MNQLLNFIYVYLVFERAFFEFVGQDRLDNIFCSPLQESDVQIGLQHLIQYRNFDFDWSKYTALNIRPITQKGTVEFRHMHGTLDRKKLMQWINLILCLKKYALRQDSENVLNRIINLNTNSEYRMFAEEVFRDHVYTLESRNLDANLSEGVKFIKEIYMLNPLFGTVSGCCTNEDKSPLGDLMKPLYKNKQQDSLSEMLRARVNNSDTLQVTDTIHRTHGGLRPTFTIQRPIGTLSPDSWTHVMLNGTTEVAALANELTQRRVAENLAIERMIMDEDRDTIGGQA